MLGSGDGAGPEGQCPVTTGDSQGKGPLGTEGRPQGSDREPGTRAKTPAAWSPPGTPHTRPHSLGAARGPGRAGGQMGVEGPPHLHPPPPPLGPEARLPELLALATGPTATQPDFLLTLPDLPGGLPPGLPDVPLALAATPDACSTTGNPAGTEAAPATGKALSGGRWRHPGD